MSIINSNDEGLKNTTEDGFLTRRSPYYVDVIDFQNIRATESELTDPAWTSNNYFSDSIDT
ncbi:MAG: hypothetical protein KAG53_01745 [Endozoicomonadaceae bacterium]|nr:hypothetical protein [Endozoicomonadaceae bacterium]